MFGSNVECDYEHYTVTVVQALIFFDWILIGLTIFGLALIFDPLGSLGKKNLDSYTEHEKVSRIWLRRLNFMCWMRKDENANETFQHVAGLLTNLFRGTDLVPSDVMAGLILLRIRQKRETHELRRLNILPRAATYTSDEAEIFRYAPSWMSLDNAIHYMKLASACYGWLYAIYKQSCPGCFHIMRNLTCCGCFRTKHNAITGDNCCYCYLAGVKVMSGISTDDILYASFKNYLCEIPFCVVVDHKMNCIVIVIRGSLSIRDIFTDIAADSESFECEGLPPGSQAHRAMITSAKLILRQLDDNKVLEHAFLTYPHYNLTITGHSLGAGIGILLALLIRPRYPNVKVYAFATPAGLLSREAARVTEEFVFTIGLGDDFVMRLGVDSTENLRTALLMTLQACRLPKYRVVLNGLGYMLFGIPEKDLSKTWTNCNVITTAAGTSPLLNERDIYKREEGKIYEQDVTKRRFSKVRLYTGGKILHLIRRKPEKNEARSNKQNTKAKYEMRWAQAEDFMELLVMPRMFLDHLPDNIDLAITTLIEQRSNVPYYIT
ncbi:sn1-specific diacylglycerol lipase beta-like isoform X2 [Ceratina calcarata]|nr:sn1-specific diacylglycerol lipase beta-like isoform X2 [Ceratina calcarata]